MPAFCRFWVLVGAWWARGKARRASGWAGNRQLAMTRRTVLHRVSSHVVARAAATETMNDWAQKTP
jgi:hypothetical protein